MTPELPQISFDLDLFLGALKRIQNRPGKNDKRHLLQELVTLSPEGKKILSLSFNPRSPMYIGEETTRSTISGVETNILYSTKEQEELERMSLGQFMTSLNNEKIPRGHKAQAAIGIFLDQNCATIEDKELVLSLIRKKPHLGLSWHSFTKVTGTDKFEVMLAKDINKIKKLDEKTQFPIYVQPKLDGYRCIAKTDTDGEWELFSRNGKKYENFPSIIEALEKYGDPEMVYDGEIMSDDFQAMQKTAFTTKKKRTVGDVSYYIFDALQDNEFARKACFRDFKLRMEELGRWYQHAWEHGATPLIKVASFFCKTWEDVYERHEFFTECGYEGTIVRLNKPYEFKRTDNLMKIKEMKSQDCHIHQVVRGKGKFSNTMGAIKVLQEDGQTLCEVGTGFTDKMRNDFWENRRGLLHKTVEIKYQELTPDGVMRFPVFLRFRDDKEAI